MLTSPSIVVASDFSESSDVALKMAERLRRKVHGKIYAIHVAPPPDTWDWLSHDAVFHYFMGEYRNNPARRAKQLLGQELKKCGVEAEGVVIFGPVVKTILDFVSRSHADILVLGYELKHHLLHLHEVASKLMARASVPVLIARCDREIERVAGLVDPYQVEKKVFGSAEELAFFCSGDLEFISVYNYDSVSPEESLTDIPNMIWMSKERRKEMEEHTAALLKRFADPHARPKFRTEISEKNEVDSLIRILEEDNIHLAVMKRHHKGKMRKFFLGSVTQGLLKHWSGNILVLP